LAEIDSEAIIDVKEEQQEEEIRVCLFSLGVDMYAIPVDLLTEIISPQKIFPVPTTPSHVIGIINLRGNIVPIVDIRQTLSLSQQSSLSGQIAVVKYGAITIGIVVDSVYEVFSVPVSSILAIPADHEDQTPINRSRFFKGIIQRETGLAALLHIERIIDEIKLT
jgi:purine-binding chemotaxis protein CheW